MNDQPRKSSAGLWLTAAVLMLIAYPFSEAPTWWLIRHLFPEPSTSYEMLNNAHDMIYLPYNTALGYLPESVQIVDSEWFHFVNN